MSIFDHHGIPMNNTAVLSERNNRIIGRNIGPNFGGMPITIRAIWHKTYETRPGPQTAAEFEERFRKEYGGEVAGDYTIPVAARIPDALIEDARKGRGGLRLKIRLHDDGVLLGWDLVGGSPGGDGEKHIGGDFREAKILNGVVVRKGWYIHPKTKEKIEIDF
jgi:hypothetical protein